jgi:hypothetical protein
VHIITTALVRVKDHDIGMFLFSTALILCLRQHVIWDVKLLVALLSIVFNLLWSEIFEEHAFVWQMEKNNKATALVFGVLTMS